MCESKTLTIFVENTKILSIIYKIHENFVKTAEIGLFGLATRSSRKKVGFWSKMAKNGQKRSKTGKRGGGGVPG
jgi:hypothetical protein